MTGPVGARGAVSSTGASVISSSDMRTTGAFLLDIGTKAPAVEAVARMARAIFMMTFLCSVVLDESSNTKFLSNSFFVAAFE